MLQALLANMTRLLRFIEEMGVGPRKGQPQELIIKYTNALERITNKILDKMKNVVTLSDAGEMSLVKSKWPELASFPD